MLLKSSCSILAPVTSADGYSVITTPSSQKTVWISLLIMIWLTATLTGLWWFQQQNVRPFIGDQDDRRFWQASQAGPLLAPLLRQLPDPESNQATLLHFWNPGCLCNQLSQRHLDGLLRQFSAKELRVVVIAPASTSAEELESFRHLNGSRMSIIRADANLSLPASPALALFGPDNQLGYFGAWGFGALCTVADDDFFPAMVRSLRQNGYGPFVNVAGEGCFCAWPAGN